MPVSSRALRAFIRICCLLCAALLLGVSLPARAATPQPKATPIPQPTRDPSAEPYDERMPELLKADQLIASSAILIEASSGDVIFAKNPDEIMYPASTTKIMTAMLTLQAMEFSDPPLSEEVTVSPYAADQPSDASVVPVQADEVLDLNDLLYGMMIKSGNDGATAIAEHISGSEASFVETMNEMASLLGCENTHFANPHGYHDPQHYTTARDLATIAKAAMEMPRFRDLAATYKYTMPPTNKRKAIAIAANNKYLNPDIEKNTYFSTDAIGIKTGYHFNAMYCYVGAANRGGVELISVVLHTSDNGRWVDTQRLMEYGFSQYEATTAMDLYKKSPRKLNVSGFDLADAAHRGEVELGIRPVKEDQDPGYIVGLKEEIDEVRANFDSMLTTYRPIRDSNAPVEAGETIGILTYFSRTGERLEYELYATRSVAARKDAPPTLEQIQAYTLADPNPLPRFSMEFVIPPLVAMFGIIALLRSWRRGRGRARKQKKRLPLPKSRSYR